MRDERSLLINEAASALDAAIPERPPNYQHFRLICNDQ
jgi:hypothetical protein